MPLPLSLASGLVSPGWLSAALSVASGLASSLEDSFIAAKASTPAAIRTKPRNFFPEPEFTGKLTAAEDGAGLLETAVAAATCFFLVLGAPPVAAGLEVAASLAAGLLAASLVAAVAKAVAALAGSAGLKSSSQDG